MTTAPPTDEPDARASADDAPRTPRRPWLATVALIVTALMMLLGLIGAALVVFSGGIP